MSSTQTQYIAISSPYRCSGKTTLAKLLGADILQRFAGRGVVDIEDEDGVWRGLLRVGRSEPHWEHRRSGSFNREGIELLALITINRPLPTPPPVGPGPSITAWRHITISGGLFQR